MAGARLAPELLRSILYSLDDSDPDTGVVLCRFSRVSRLFHAVAADDKLWKTLYSKRWRRHRSRAAYIDLLLGDGSSEQLRHQSKLNAGRRSDVNDDDDCGGRGMASTDSYTETSSQAPDDENVRMHTLSMRWKRAYGDRHVTDGEALDSIQRITDDPTGRYAQARTILAGSRMDAFDALLAYQSDLLSRFPIHEALDAKVWVREMLDSLRRSEALQTWMEMVTSGGEISTVDAINAFSGFRGCDQVELQDKLESLTGEVRRNLGSEFQPGRSDILKVVQGICQTLSDRGIKPASFGDFHRLSNHFVNLVIDGPTTTLPMTLRILCRIEGWACGPDGAVEESFPPSISHGTSTLPFYVCDIFDGGKVLSNDELHRRLANIGIPPTQAGNFLHAARPSELVARTARNIITSLQQDDGDLSSHMETSRSAHAAVAALLFLQPNNLVDALPNILLQFSIDVYSIEQDYIPVVLREGAEGLLMADRLRKIQRAILERDAQEIVPRFRAAEREPEKGDDKEIMFKIGTIFRHRRWGYTGVIRRWDPRCLADEGWMMQNNIDGLDNGGRHQPFYSISADDGSDRYIAQANVIPMRSVAANTLRRIIQSHDDLGTVFSRVDVGRALFVMEEGARRKYPEDAKWQEDVMGMTPAELEKAEYF